MNPTLFRWSSALITALAIAGCGGGGGGGGTTTPLPVTGTPVNAAITTASAVVINDTATNTSSAFSVLQAAGVPAVTIASPPVINFTVFSDKEVLQGLSLTAVTGATPATPTVRVALAKLVPGTNGNPDEWVSYVTRTKVATYPGAPASSTVVQGTTDTGGTLTYSTDGYYTYTFGKDVKLTTDANGNKVYDETKTHRVALQLSYTNKAGVVVKANPYFDFRLVKKPDGITVESVTATPAQTRKMTDVTSCNSCHEKLAIHGGGRVDTQYCVVCHNSGTTDPVTGNVVTLSTMVHKIHAGKRLFAAGDPYQVASLKFDEVGFPQDLRNCTKCHTAANAATPQGDNWKTVVSKAACLSCHSDKPGAIVPAGKKNWDTNHIGYAKDVTIVGAAAAAANTKATDLTNAQCVACHIGSISPEVVHWNQNEENGAKYKMNIESAVYAAVTGDAKNKGMVTVKYFLSDPTNGDKPHKLLVDTAKCTPNAGGATVRGSIYKDCNSTLFGNLKFYLGYQSLKGQPTAVTEFSSYNNGGSVSYACLFEGTATSGSSATNGCSPATNDGTDHYTVTIPVPLNTTTFEAAGTARVISVGVVKEPLKVIKTITVPRPDAAGTTLVSVAVQNTHKDVAISGTLQPRREIVSNAKCNACHSTLGSTSGANTAANAFHGGGRDTVEACSVCHDVNLDAKSGKMTNGFDYLEPYQFKRLIHNLHGSSKRVYPFTLNNQVVGVFCNPAGITVAAIANCTANNALATPLTLAAGVENWAAEIAWPGAAINNGLTNTAIGINCNACHVNNSYKNDLGPLGTKVIKLASPAGTPAPALITTDPATFKVISPKASSCTSCHDSSTAMAHVTAIGGASFANKSQAEVAGLGLAGYPAVPAETCNDCHAPGGFKGVDIVHGQK